MNWIKVLPLSCKIWIIKSEHTLCDISTLLPKTLAMFDELTHSDDNSIVKQQCKQATRPAQPIRTEREHVLVRAESAQWLQRSVGCCPGASAVVAPQVGTGESCHVFVCISLETLPQCDFNSLNLTCIDRYPQAQSSPSDVGTFRGIAFSGMHLCVFINLWTVRLHTVMRLECLSQIKWIFQIRIFDFKCSCMNCLSVFKKWRKSW